MGLGGSGLAPTSMLVRRWVDPTLTDEGVTLVRAGDEQPTERPTTIPIAPEAVIRPVTDL